MVEVVKRGDKNIVECKFCGSELRYRIDDIKKKESYYSQFESNIVEYIICPECGSEVRL